MRVPSASFVLTLVKTGCPRDVLHRVALDLNTFEVFESVRKREVSAEDGATLLLLKREAERASEPWLVKFIRWCFAS